MIYVWNYETIKHPTLTNDIDTEFDRMEDEGAFWVLVLVCEIWVRVPSALRGEDLDFFRRQDAIMR